jgi:hypothetical protein
MREEADYRNQATTRATQAQRNRGTWEGRVPLPMKLPD